MPTAGHPALRVPLPGGGSGTWATVTEVAGLPVLVADPAAWRAHVSDEEIDSPLDELPYPAIMTIARYLPHVGVDSPLRAAVRRALAHAPADAQLAVEVGCSVGPDLAALRAVAAHVIAFDLYLPALRAALARVRGEPLPTVIRVEGRSFELDDARVLPALDGVTLVVGDAQDPPVHPGSADVVLALNVLDNVAEPRLVLAHLDALLRPGGLLVLGAPFAWQDAITPLANQLGGAPEETAGNTPAMLDTLLGPSFAVLTREDVPWVLRDHARAEFHYLVHLVAARKLSQPS